VTQQFDQPRELERKPSAKLAHSLLVLRRLQNARLQGNRADEERWERELAKIDGKNEQALEPNTNV